MARDGSLAARAVEHLQTLDDGARLSSEELAAAIGYDGNSLSQCLAGARKRGELCTEREGRAFVWFLPEPEDDAPEEFNAALWLDGDLVIRGAQINEDNSVTLTSEQLVQLKKLIAWSPAP